MRKFLVPFVLLLGALGAPLAAHAAESVSVRAILIQASNGKGPSDPKLKPYEAELQRNLVFSSFRYMGEGSTSLVAGGRATVKLAGGHRLELQSERFEGGSIGVKVQWLNGSELVISTSLTLQRGVPAVLVHRGNDDAEAVLLIAK